MSTKAISNILGWARTFGGLAGSPYLQEAVAELEAIEKAAPVVLAVIRNNEIDDVAARVRETEALMAAIARQEESK